MPTEFTLSSLDVVLHNHKLLPADEQLAAVGAECVAALVSGHVADVDILQADLLGCAARLLQGSQWGRRKLGQFADGEKAGEVDRCLLPQFISNPPAHLFDVF